MNSRVELGHLYAPVGAINEAQNSSTSHEAELLYRLSHDLRAPVRHVQQFSNLLVNKIDTRLTDSEREYAVYLQHAVHELDGMLTALLTLSRINVDSEPTSRCDIELIVLEVCKRLEYSSDELTTHFQCKSLIGIENQLVRLFEELLSNAKQYQFTERPLMVRVSSRMEGQWCVIEIQDNGLGMSPTKLRDPFRLFSCANRSLDQKGVGAGLCIVQKIIETHDGHVQMQSEENTGTIITCRFRLTPDDDTDYV